MANILANSSTKTCFLEFSNFWLFPCILSRNFANFAKFLELAFFGVLPNLVLLYYKPLSCARRNIYFDMVWKLYSAEILLNSPLRGRIWPEYLQVISNTVSPLYWLFSVPSLINSAKPRVSFLTVNKKSRIEVSLPVS